MALPVAPSEETNDGRSGSSTSDLSTISSSEKDLKPVNGKGKKRARESDASQGGKKKARQSGGTDNQIERGVYCHICRRMCQPDRHLRCTKIKGAAKRCHLSYCYRDLTVRYGLSPEKLSEIRGGHRQPLGIAGDNGSTGYHWECPCCNDHCQSSGCRKKKGLEPIGNVSKAMKAVSSAQTSAAAFLEQRQDISGKLNHSPNNSSSTPNKFIPSKGKTTPSGHDVHLLGDDSELSEIEEKKGKSKPSGTTPKAKPIKKKTPTPKTSTPKSAKTNGDIKKKTASKLKSTPVVEINGKKPKMKIVKDVINTPKKKDSNGTNKKPKPLKKPEIPPEPPIFEKVDTKLGREEAEQRIMLREYLFRFRAVLSFPERALPAVDDFDRPLTEASVRLFAGAMLDMIKDEMQGTSDEELNGTLFNVREELRYYADLARFQGIYNMLAKPLNLRLPSVIVDKRAEANNSALRAILDLDDNQSPPAWATDLTAGPSRRTAASRIPPAPEVIRMLLGFAERTLSTPKIRGDMESAVLENEARRKHASALKRELVAMESKKKKLNEIRLKSKTAAETKANKEEHNSEMRGYTLRVALLDVNLQAQLARRTLRYEPLGQDIDGRIFYVLAPRTIEDEGRPPLGWASGLLVWGPGIAGKTGGDEGMPVSTDRWSHFGKSKDVNQLIIWVEWTFKKYIESLRPAQVSKPKTPVRATPSKSAPGSTRKTPGSKMKQKTLEVVIPTSAKRNSASGESSLSTFSATAKALGDDASSTSSGLTPPPTAAVEELLALVDPEGYIPSPEVVEENANLLVSRLRQVAKWLEVLEWKGFGELV
ncbi:uncharacterized protein IL334_003479 [Kwoniella shivajii]|uniref:Zinc-finger domain-containing protein n=1 Tax=Kwoniella shivajii TaxID=564305 RepID=A0ABZ1CXP3_9TREE|nr:hypothetical protein IL334_003479 [Kwoniella shivajii]